ncbi:hypothetical protein JL193_08825 [Polaribacter batillariae]|uniref:Lipoprotein n=1 Tax=Polaribacter batillariae TaxID=2808900 RepID=A0ABX7STV0_9FLAO|nr:hypothetical protein [Polaribacter batillariae]QTD36269.1 hypothetical protein JL193_08825 [Polaribacter batillariae]
MKIIKIFCMLLLISCSKQKYMITSNKIGEFILGNKLDNKYDLKNFDIKTDDNNKITSIICKSKRYKTNDGYGVGTDINLIKKKNDFSESKITLSKESQEIGDFGNVYIYNNIAFIDVNLDSIVDFVWIEKK